MSWILPSPAVVLDGVHGRCRTVSDGAPKRIRRRAQNRMWYARNREALRAYHRAYYHAKRKGNMKRQTRDKEARRAADRARYWRNPEKFRAEARERARRRYRNEKS
ncbi:MAG: hypothetical protein Q8P46_15585 [Hyphomicrobiales bacterium]|nr:hypothetical protein [Hyphomicrobiales bacterium]